ncbi:MAG TPA: hypothetical protein DHW82_08285 [Spirochaetia bacterium]|nr:MAG: hypothetical protein A2Y41_13985 [Spirochaetes bacterium GWB1_36_13]HCL56991.1 hypothetical protein [Spirochaetia bacterium]
MSDKILIVDDDPINLKLFTIIADKNKILYDTASDGRQVETLIQQNFYKLILLDIQLPGIDGFTLLKSIKEKHPQTKVIAVTAYAMMGDKERILKAGADEYLAKPINIDDLVERMKANLK